MSSVSRKQSSDHLASPPASPLSQQRKARSRQPSQSNTSAAQSLRDARRPQRRASAASVASSIGGTLDIAHTDTLNSNDYNQNAISTLLAPPIVRTGLIPHTTLPASSAYRAPTSRDIPPVALTSIPNVDSSVFHNYLSQVGPLFESLNRAKQASDEAEARTPRRSRASNPNDYFGDVARERSRDEISSPVETPSSTSSRRPSVISPSASTPSAGPRPRRGTATRRAPPAPTPLSSIPDVYFDQDFHLENPRTFDIVSEFSDIIPPERHADRESSRSANGAAKAPAGPPRKALHTNAILQEKLSWYMDTVEIHLVSSIASASTSFFAALGSLRELQAEAARSIEQIKDLRQALSVLDSEMAVGGLELANLRRRSENLRKLGNAVEQLSEVVAQAQKCDELVEEGQVDAATRAIDKLELLIRGSIPSDQQPDASPKMDLRGLKALDGVSEGVQDLRRRIGRGFEDRFRGALLNDLRAHVSNVPARETLQRWSNATFRGRPNHSRVASTSTAYLQTSEELRADLEAALAGLSKAGHTAKATTAYREALMREIKSMIRTHLPSSNDDDAESTTSVSTRGGRRLTQQEKSAILARNIRALDPEAAEELLVKVYTSVGEALRRLGHQVKILLDVTSTIETKPRTSNDSSEPHTAHLSEELTQALDMSSLLGQAVDLVQNQVSKVLKVRRDETVRLPISQFLRYFIINRLFVDECEALCGRSGDLLKEIVNNHIKEFLNVLADTQKAKISEQLDADRWEAKDFGPAENVVVSRIIEGMTTTPKAWLDYVSLWDANYNVDTVSSSNGVSNGQAPSDKVRSASIDGQKYILVGSAQGALHGMDEFAHVIAAIPQLAPDAANHLLAYLKLFNSRACQLILGTGATKSAGLKNITAKHLALASQACSFVVALLPYIRELVRRHLPSSAATTSTVLGEFDRVKRLFQDHQTSIHEKLVDIMASRSAAHMAAFRKIDWEAAGREGGGPSKCIDDLCRDFNTLHRTLSRHVSEIDLKMIMNPTFTQFREDWVKAVDEADLKTQKAKERLHTDVDTIVTRLSKIDGSEEISQALLNAIQQKQSSNPDTGATAGRGEPEADRTNTNARKEAEKPASAKTVPEPGEAGQDEKV